MLKSNNGNLISELLPPMGVYQSHLLRRCVFYSKWEGYKEVEKTQAFIDFFIKNKLKTESIHTSGHADVLAIKDFVKKIDPQKIIPVHTETPEKYKELFNNKVILLDDKKSFEI